MVLQTVLPAVHVGRCPASINAADRDATVFARFRQDLFNKCDLSIIGIDQNRDRARLVFEPFDSSAIRSIVPFLLPKMRSGKLRNRKLQKSSGFLTVQLHSIIKG